MGDFFQRTYTLIAQKKRWAFLVLLVVAASLIAISSKIEFDDDISSLIPQSEESKKVQEILKSIAFTDKIIVNISRGPNATVNDLTQYAADLIDSIQKNNAAHIKNIQGKLNDEDLPNTLNLAYENLPLFLDADDYALIEQKLEKDSIAKTTAQNFRTLTSPSGIIAKKTLVKDPLGLSFIALKKLQQLGIGADFKLKNGFLLNKEESNILLFITPIFASGETDKNAPFVAALYELQSQLKEKHGSRVSHEYFGAALVAVANANQIKRDVQFTAGIALLVLLVILILFYRKLTLPIVLFLPTLFGALLSIAFLCIIRTKISAISLGIGSVLLGVTLDYSLHILTHIRNGKSIQSLYKDVSPSILMSSLTTASAFLCLLFLKSQALQDLGIFAAISVLGASVFALLFIPQVYQNKKESLQKSTLIDRVSTYAWHKNKWVIAALSLFLIGSLFTYRTVNFNQDISKLNYESEILTRAREHLETLTDIGSKSIYLSTYGSDQEAVLQKNDALFEQLNQLQTKEEIVSFSSIGALVHSHKEQNAKIAAWKDFWNEKKKENTKKNLIESGMEFGFKPSSFESFYNLLNKDFRPVETSELNSISSFPIEDYIVSDSLSTTITSLIKVEEAQIQNLRRATQNETNTLLIDRKQVNETFLGNLKNDFNRLIWYSLVVVVLLLVLFYRSLSLTLVTAIPLFLSWFLTIGLMGFFKIEFNIFNIIISSFIFGLGVDYSIFITNGLLAEYRTGESTLSTHKTSIVLSVITTLLGIGVLIFAKHPALYSVSAVCVIGILSAALMAFTIQPLLFRLFLGGPDKRPIKPRVLLHSLLSFAYFQLGGLLLSAFSWIVMKINPKAHFKKQMGLHKVTSKFMKSVLYTNPFVSKKIVGLTERTFEKPAMLIANHSSFLDILAMGQLHPKLVYLVKDHVYNSPIIGSAAKLHGAYPVSGGVDGGEEFLRQKVDQGFSIIAFPEGARSETNKINRFHKGAFYLAEKLDLDILPVMIHGGSEISPKNSFIIRDGGFTVKILPRIKASDTNFGTSYSQKPKQLGQYFRSQFRELRNKIEGTTYWHSILLENYRLKDKGMFKSVKNDLTANQKAYLEIIRFVGEKDRIIHLSNEYGQLDLLLALDSFDRKIHSCLENKEARAILKNNYLTHNYSKITVVDTMTQAFKAEANVLLIDSDIFSMNEIGKEKMDEITILILLKSGKNHRTTAIETFGFEIQKEKENVLFLKKEIA
jgi:1-acyl-sn-glycerol-3-phosphate acyltransferase